MSAPKSATATGATGAVDLAGATRAIETATDIVSGAAAHLATLSDGGGRLDEHQVLAYDLAHAAAGTQTGGALLGYGEHGELEARIAAVFAADVVADLVARTAGREDAWATIPGWHSRLAGFLAAARDPDVVGSLADAPGPYHLHPDFELVRDSFRRFATEQ
ncbi:MAG: hypothetical protein ACRD0B_05115, partial [Acidimicrobiales bacterium]